MGRLSTCFALPKSDPDTALEASVGREHHLGRTAFLVHAWNRHSPLRPVGRSSSATLHKLKQLSVVNFYGVSGMQKVKICWKPSSYGFDFS